MEPMHECEFLLLEVSEGYRRSICPVCEDEVVEGVMPKDGLRSVRKVLESGAYLWTKPGGPIQAPKRPY